MLRVFKKKTDIFFSFWLGVFTNLCLSTANIIGVSGRFRCNELTTQLRIEDVADKSLYL